LRNARCLTPVVAAVVLAVAATALAAGGPRLTLHTTDHPRPGQPIAVSLREPTGAGGVSARVCASFPGLHRCRTLTFPKGSRVLRTSFLPRVAGRGHITARSSRGQRLSRALTVRRRPGTRLRVLATGDSMIQIIDSFLAQRLDPLRGVTVRSDAHISTGISKPFFFDWAAHARRQAASHPDVTIMFIGANDGFDMGSARCCGAAWTAEYARRARRMMAAYEQGGRARVYWMTLPVPGRAAFRPVFRAVNRAIRRAAATTGGLVRVLDFEAVFTPRGVFQQSIVFRGHRYSVRQGDKVHLNTTGARIGATLISEALRRDGLLG
jgi:hypothetical protein